MRWWRPTSLLLATLLAGCAEGPLPAPPPACGPLSRSTADGCVALAWKVSEPPLSEPGARDPVVAIDAEGRAIGAWTVDRGDRLAVRIAEESGSGEWSSRDLAPLVGGDASFVALRAGANGAVVAWRSATPERAAIFTAARAGSAWTEPSTIADALSFGTTAYEPTLATNASGEWLVTWNQWVDTSNLYGVAITSRPDLDTPWSALPTASDLVSQPVFYSNGPVIAMNDAGEALVAWYQSLGGPLRIFASERASGGAPFSRPTADDALSPAGSAVVGEPRVAIGSDGAAAIVWSGEAGPSDVPVFLATRSSDGAWTIPSSIEDTFSWPSGTALRVEIALSPANELYVVWEQDFGTGSEVFAARRRADGTWVEDGRHAIRLSASGSLALAPKIAVAPSGAAVVVWQERAPGGRFRVQARSAASADAAWAPAENVSGELDLDDVQPVVALGVGDRGTVLFTRGAGADAHIHAASLE